MAIEYYQYMRYLSLWFGGVLGLFKSKNFDLDMLLNQVELVVLRWFLAHVYLSNYGVDMVIVILSKVKNVT